MWIARLSDGSTVTEKECAWDDLDIYQIASLQLRTKKSPRIVLTVSKHIRNQQGEQIQLSNFVEYVQFKTAVVHFGRRGPSSKPETVSQSIGWTDGTWEYLVTSDYKTGNVKLETIKRVHRHPMSR